ncbi:hypothetical protein OHC33_006647 [Knufia fluminis]|uniref:Uncharacterized protein n=1 Tax=Knufia fluminis TaxID=191047 RepID=A0AAN8I4U7_9EURO|nr:hypothetical protein OHC33_006647 [Knufia fluminis]
MQRTLDQNAMFTLDRQVILFDKLSAAVRAMEKERVEETEWRAMRKLEFHTAEELHQAQLRAEAAGAIRARYVRVPRPMEFSRRQEQEAGDTEATSEDEAGEDVSAEQGPRLRLRGGDGDAS